MPAYVIGEAEILDPIRMKSYAPMVADAVAKFGGRYLARGAAPDVLEGGAAHRMLIIEFPDTATARRWYGSPEYAAAKKIREDGGSRLRLLLIEGLPSA
jgi:uncharacterized protein (DUF1330 family)